MKIEQGKMRILLACADESLLKQTKRLMQASNELELVGCTSNGTKAWEMIRQKRRIWSCWIPTCHMRTALPLRHG